MIKVTENIDIVNDESELPKLMVSKLSGLVILVTEVSGINSIVGMVVKGTSEYSVGHYSDEWCWSSFTDYGGEITLKNL